MIDQPPESLVRGCNDPVSIGILSDWIEEQYGVALDLDKSGWGDSYDYSNDHSNGNAHGMGSGWSDGSGNGCGEDFYFNGYSSMGNFENGNGNGNGCENFYGGIFDYEYGSGHGYGGNYSHDCKKGDGYGYGYGIGYLITIRKNS